MWNRLDDMAAHGEVETAVFGVEVVDALVLESKPRCKTRITRPRKIQMRIDDIDTEDAGSRKELRQARCRFARAASRVEDPCLGRERIAAQERHFLRPDGARLRGEVAHHRLVGHLPGLRIEIGHGVLAVIRDDFTP